jgi:DNA-binding PadR family transcriptional regulator
MPLPEITHLQFAVLASLLDGDMTGADLRESLRKLGSSHTRAAFYQLMARLEDAGFVEGRYEQKTVADATITERVYQLTVTGEKALNAARNFYVAFQPGFLCSVLA